MGRTDSSTNSYRSRRRKIHHRRYMYLPAYHHVVMMIISVSIVFLSILLAGCTSTNLKNVYLLSLSYTNDGASPAENDSTQINPNISTTFTDLVKDEDNNVPSLEIRAGYMGMCMRELEGDWLCSRNAEDLADIIRENNKEQEISVHDPLNLIWIAKDFRSQSVFSGLIFASIPLTFICLVSLAVMDIRGPRREEKDEDSREQLYTRLPSKWQNYFVMAIMVVTTILTSVSVLWQHIVSSAAVALGQNLSYGTVQGQVGTVAMVLGWGGVFVDVLSVLAVIIQIVSFIILERLD